MSSFADVEAANAVQRHDSRVGRIAAHFQRAAMHVRQGVPHHAVHVLWATCHIGEHGKSSNEQHAKNARDPFPETIHSLFLPHMNLCSCQEGKLTRLGRAVHPRRLRAVQVSIELWQQKYCICISGGSLAERPSSSPSHAPTP